MSVCCSLVELIRSLMGSPPEFAHIVAVTDFLVLLHRASATYVTHLRSSFYFLLSPTPPSNPLNLSGTAAASNIKSGASPKPTIRGKIGNIVTHFPSFSNLWSQLSFVGSFIVTSAIENSTHFLDFVNSFVNSYSIFSKRLLAISSACTPDPATYLYSVTDYSVWTYCKCFLFIFISMGAEIEFLLLVVIILF